MTLRGWSREPLTVSGLAFVSSTTSEHVASTPRPLTADAGIAASAIAARTEAAHAAQISADDCSTPLPVSSQNGIGCRAVARHPPSPGHLRAANPCIVHLRIAFDECV